MRANTNLAKFYLKIRPTIAGQKRLFLFGAAVPAIYFIYLGHLVGNRAF